MNKLSANISLYIITFFAAVQYAFLVNVPASVSNFAFLAITNGIGFLITFCAFFGELRRLDRKQVEQSAVLSMELLAFNFLLLLGSRDSSATVVSCVLSAYFALVVLLAYLLFHQVPDKFKTVGIAIVLLGVFFMMDANIMGLLQVNVLLLVGADVFFALYLLTVERYAAGSNPALLAMGQTLFNCIIAFICWMGECAINRHLPTLPDDQRFWGSVFFISFFIRGLYGIVQVYAQRYVSPLNVSLIFSTEIIMTMLASPALALVFGIDEEPITPIHMLGAGLMVTGILISDSSVTGPLLGRIKNEKE